MKDYPLVSLISINYNQPEVTCEFLDSMRKVTYPKTEIIIVDNGSHVPIDLVENNYPEITLIKSKQNLGFAGGNNLGVDKAKGKYLLFINNDTEVEPGFLEPMVDLLESDETIGMVSPKIKFFYHPDTIQYAGYGKLNKFTLRMTGLGYGVKDNGQLDQLTETNFAHGCAMMIPKKVVEKAGQMPDPYFLYYEEHDWCIRIKRAGYRVFYQPESVVLHKESISTGKGSPLKTYYFTRNRILFGRRNVSGITAKLSMFYMIVVAFPKNLITYLLKLDIKHLRAYVKAILWHVKYLHKSFRVNDGLIV